MASEGNRGGEDLRTLAVVVAITLCPNQIVLSVALLGLLLPPQELEEEMEAVLSLSLQSVW